MELLKNKDLIKSISKAIYIGYDILELPIVEKKEKIDKDNIKLILEFAFSFPYYLTFDDFRTIGFYLKALKHNIICGKLEPTEFLFNGIEPINLLDKISILSSHATSLFLTVEDKDRELLNNKVLHQYHTLDVFFDREQLGHVCTYESYRIITKGGVN